MTWDNSLLPLHPSRLFNMQKINGYYQISIKQCISGYGPAALSNGISCTDCSKYQNIWLLNLLLIFNCILLLTIMFVVIMMLQIKGTAGPWNVIITYSQLVVNALMNDAHLRNRIQCYVGKRGNNIILLLTMLGVTNLDFLRLIILSPCISTSLTAIHTLFLTIS